MKPFRIILSTVTVLISLSSLNAHDGKQLFRGNCASCHALGKKLVGPDLIGVNEKRDRQWLVKWIKSSQTMVREGDALAVQVFNEGNKIPMPDAFINEEEINAVLEYIKSEGSPKASANAASEVAVSGNSASSAQLTPVKPQEPNTHLLNMFSFSEYLLLGLICVFLIVIWVLARAVRAISTQLKEKYNGQ